ncbi:MAG: ABC transporter ATP-binding protein, partial [Oxalobacteraceae bacterium]|nr:ABC transporter ATP-binding protein [Oxalobacteraceae bacterium]
TAGTIRVADATLGTLSPRAQSAFRRSEVSFVFQTFNLFPGLSAIENVQFTPEYNAWYEQQQRGKAKSSPMF